ncbi:MAG TPA: hypothetical protein VGN14_09075 [Candidatus Elarobacter sp.]|jgi:hypothetical protein
MGRRHVGVWICLVVAPVLGYGASVLGDAEGWSPLVAAAAPLVLVALCGRLLRGREPSAILGAGAAVGFAAFVGLALARATESNLLVTGYDGGRLWFYWPLPIRSWPLLLLCAMIYGIALAVLVALPISRIVATPAIDREHDARFWEFVRDHTPPDEVAR